MIENWENPYRYKNNGNVDKHLLKLLIIDKILW